MGFFPPFFVCLVFFFVFNQQQFLLWDEIGWATECLDFIIIVCIFIRMEFMKEISNFWKVITIIIIIFSEANLNKPKNESWLSH